MACVKSWIMIRPTSERTASGPRGGQAAPGVPRPQARIPLPAPWAAKDVRRILLPRPERLPWPRAVLLIGLLSVALWAIIVGAVLLAIR